MWILFEAEREENICDDGKRKADSNNDWLIS